MILAFLILLQNAIALLSARLSQSWVDAVTTANNTLVARLTATRAGLLDNLSNLDAAISSIASGESLGRVTVIQAKSALANTLTATSPLAPYCTFTNKTTTTTLTTVLNVTVPGELKLVLFTAQYQGAQMEIIIDGVSVFNSTIASNQYMTVVGGAIVAYETPVTGVAYDSVPFYQSLAVKVRATAPGANVFTGVHYVRMGGS